MQNHNLCVQRLYMDQTGNTLPQLINTASYGRALKDRHVFNGSDT